MNKSKNMKIFFYTFLQEATKNWKRTTPKEKQFWVCDMFFAETHLSLSVYNLMLLQETDFFYFFVLDGLSMKL